MAQKLSAAQHPLPYNAPCTGSWCGGHHRFHLGVNAALAGAATPMQLPVTLPMFPFSQLCTGRWWACTIPLLALGGPLPAAPLPLLPHIPSRLPEARQGL